MKADNSNPNLNQKSSNTPAKIVKNGPAEEVAARGVKSGRKERSSSRSKTPPTTTPRKRWNFGKSPSEKPKPVLNSQEEDRQIVHSESDNLLVIIFIS